jgi:hypothetical protein
MAGQYTKLPAISTSAPAGSATAANQVLEIAQLTTIATNTTNAGTPVVSGTVAVSNFPATQPVSGTVTANAGTDLNTSALALESGGNLASLNTKLPAQGQALAAASLPVVLPAAQQTALTPVPLYTATATLSNVSGSATSVTVLASNASRKAVMIFNDSAATLYLKFGATASTSSYTVQIGPNGYYEMPANPVLYTGILDGIWSSATGAARVTELS